MAEKSTERVIEYSPKGSTPERKGGMPFPAFAALLLTWAAMAGGFIYLQKHQPVPPKPADTSALEQEVAALKAQLAGQPDTGGDIASLKQELAEVKSQPQQDNTPQITDMEKRLAALEASAQRKEAPRPLMLAALTLRDRVTNSLPYAADLAALKELATEDEALSDQVRALEVILQQGIPSTAALLEQLKGFERELLALSQNPAASWQERMEQAFARLVTVRRLGAEQQGTDADAVIARAEHDLSQGALDDAVKELHTLPDPAQQKAAAWLASAERSLKADEVFTAIYTRINAMKAAPSSPPPAPMDMEMMAPPSSAPPMDNSNEL